MRRVRIALLGCGTVGGGFVRLLSRERDRLRERYGVDAEISQILVRNLSKERPGVPRELLTDSPLKALDGDCDVVVEVIGGTHSAGAYIRRALLSGRDVVTANKAHLAERGRELFDAAAERGLFIGFEASVCGAVPIIRMLQHALAGDSVESLIGIVNGTCNFILTRMEEGMEFDQALRSAQQCGLAEADPTLDIDGIDAEQKLRILAELAFAAPVRRVTTRGIRHVVLKRGSVLRLVAEAYRVPGGVELRVEPRELPPDHPLAAVRDEENAVIIRGRAMGEVMIRGKGAGSLPTASAVLSDVVEIARLRPPLGHAKAAADAAALLK
jgi:homoserine dehydrogenase